jgi:hypothetical protein
MGALFRYLIALLMAYVLVWTAAYVYTVMNAVGYVDLTYYFQWLVWGWGVGGDMAHGAVILSILFFFPFAAATLFLARRLGNKSADNT